MKRWKPSVSREVESPRIDAFLSDIVEVYRKHGLCLSHEDTQGGFEVMTLDEHLVDWLMDASDRVTE